MSPNLEHWLAIHYRARVLGHGTVEQALDTLSTRLQADQSLMREAVEEKNRIEALASLCGGTSQLSRRCHVSAIHLEALSRVI